MDIQHSFFAKLLQNDLSEFMTPTCEFTQTQTVVATERHLPFCVAPVMIVTAVL